MSVARWKRIVPALAVGLGLIGTTGSPVLAGNDVGVHAGRFGFHYVVGNPELAGIECTYDARDKLESVRIQAPLVYGRDPDQKVAWRYLIVNSDYEVVAHGTLHRAWVAWHEPARFSNDRYTPTTGEGVSVKIEMRWYAEDDSTIEGVAIDDVHVARWTFADGTHYQVQQGACADTGFEPWAPPNVDYDSGVVGRHLLVDDREAPTIVCTYVKYAQGSSVIVLDSIAMRPPIIYARDRTSGVDAQEVGYRYRILRLLDGGASTQTEYVSPVQRARARDVVPAALTWRTWDDNVPGKGYRVRYELFWYDGAGRVVGSAFHPAETYLEHAPTYDSVDKGGVANCAAKH